MSQHLAIVMLPLLLLAAPGCGAGGEESAGEAEASDDGDDNKYAIGGRVRPAWIETLMLVTESMSLTATGGDLQRAAKLALAASELAAEHPLLLGYTELTLAFVELRRGKVAAFERLMVRGLGRVPADAKHTDVALLAAEQSVRRGRLDPSRAMLGLWRRRLEQAGEAELAEKIEAKAREHLGRIRGKDKNELKGNPLKPPPDDFPIVLPN
jgi:hypothetical protein